MLQTTSTLFLQIEYSTSEPSQRKKFMNMLRYTSLFLLLSMSSAFRVPNHAMMARRTGTAIRSESTNTDSSSSEHYETYTDGTVNPCWQDIYDADCNMDSIFTARFVASEWIKGLPCGSGMEVSRVQFSSVEIKAKSRIFRQRGLTPSRVGRSLFVRWYSKRK